MPDGKNVSPERFPQMRDTALPPARVESELKERLTEYARKQDRTISWVIEKAVEEYLERHGDEG